MRKIYLLFLSFCMPFVVLCQETWDLEKCISYAIEHSIEIKQSDLLIQDAEVLQKMSEQQLLPSVSGSTGASINFGKSIDPTTNDFNNQSTFSNTVGLNTSILLYNGGRLKNNIRQSEILKKASSADKNSMITTVTLNVVTAYFEALLARDNYSNAEIQLKTINDQIVQMQKLVRAGSRAQFEIYDLEAQQASSEQQLTIAQNNIDLSILSLKGFMNLDPNTDIILADPPVEQLTYTDLDIVEFEDVYRNVLSTRPELEALNLRITSGEIDLEIAQGAFFPTISAGASFASNFSNRFIQGFGFMNEIVNTPVFINGEAAVLGREQSSPRGTEVIPYFNQFDQNFQYGFGVQVNIPILDNYNAKGNRQRSRINLESLKANKEQYIIDLRNILGQYLTDAKASKRNLEAVEKLLSARQISYDNAQKRFNLGAINSFDYISIQDQLNTARTDQLIAKYDYIMKIKILDFYQGFPVTLK